MVVFFFVLLLKSCKSIKTNLNIHLVCAKCELFTCVDFGYTGKKGAFLQILFIYLFSAADGVDIKSFPLICALLDPVLNINCSY